MDPEVAKSKTKDDAKIGAIDKMRSDATKMGAIDAPTDCRALSRS